MPDVNDIVAIDARRQLAEVKAGGSIREAKAANSKWKDLARKYVNEDEPEAYREFMEELKDTKTPGHNFGVTAAEFLEDSKSANVRLSPEEEAEEMERLQAESIENEMKVTRTGTGAPKVDESGNVVTPIQAASPDADSQSKREQKDRDRRKEQEDKDNKDKDKDKATQLPAQTVVVTDKDKK